ncbi:MAG: hydrolase [Halopseudomonas sabulinigri]
MSPFRPATWLPGGHLQTLFNPLLRKPPSLQRQRVRMTLSDGDYLDLDWHGSTQQSAPIAILLHGLTGSSASLYILGQQRALAAVGWRSVAVNWRGCSGEPNHTARAYHSGASDDLAEVVEHIHNLNPDQPLFAVGYSLGGNVLLKYLGERGVDSPLHAAVAVSVPFRLDQCADRLQVGFSRVYQSRFMRDMLAYVANKKRLFQHQGLDAEYARLDVLGSLDGMDSFWDFDGRITAPLHGFASAQDYYRRCSSRYFLGEIRLPTLIIQAQNDPFVYPHSLPESNELSASTEFELHQRGGHVGFVEGLPWRPGYYLERRIPQWLAAQLADTPSNGK